MSTTDSTRIVRDDEWRFVSLALQVVHDDSHCPDIAQRAVILVLENLRSHVSAGERGREREWAFGEELTVVCRKSHWRANRSKWCFFSNSSQSLWPVNQQKDEICFLPLSVESEDLHEYRIDQFYFVDCFLGEYFLISDLDGRCLQTKEPMRDRRKKRWLPILCR